MWNVSFDGILIRGVRVKKKKKKKRKRTGVENGLLIAKLMAKQGVTVLGTPLGRTEFVEGQLAGKIEEHGILLDRINEGD